VAKDWVNLSNVTVLICELRVFGFLSIAMMLAAGLRAGEIRGWAFGGDPKEFQIGLDRDTRHGGNISGYIACISGRAQRPASLVQIFRSDDFAASRVRFSAWIKTEDVGAAYLWMRVNGEAGEALNFDKRDKHAARGTRDWTQQAVVLDVPRLAAAILIGFTLQGRGRAWIDDAVVEVVDHGTKTTGWLVRPGPPAVHATGYYPNRRPVNLDFEQ
jgi:hypothetical protein